MAVDILPQFKNRILPAISNITTTRKMSEEELAGKNHVIVEGLIALDSSLIGKTIMPHHTALIDKAVLK